MSASPEHRTLVLDAELRHSLAIVRSLGRRGVPVLAASSLERFPARYSRYAAGHVQLPSGADAETLRSIIERERIDVVIPGGLPGNTLLCRHRVALEPLVRAPFNPLTEFDRLANKHATVQLAKALDVPYPETVEVRDPDQARSIASEVGLPVVIKSPVDQGSVRYAHSAVELEQLAVEFFDANPGFADQGLFPIAQRYIEGGGHGFYGLADAGQILAYFMHRRIHEVPPSGGASAMAASYRDPVLHELGQRFFAATGWTGVAMVEFKRSREDGRYYLLEVNPKFWGSLDLSIAAGVDFPYLLYQMLTGAPITAQPGAYRDDETFRWLTMDLAYAIATKNPFGYVRAFADRTIQDDLDRRDLKPTAMLFASGVRRVAGGGRRSSSSPALRAFYLAKPLIPRPAQIALRRTRATRIWERLGKRSCSAIPRQPLGYEWPDGARACALVTHDVELSAGQRNIPALLEVEREFDLLSCWNFVVRRYEVDTSLQAELRQAGHEIGVHGVYHDGKKFDSEVIFRERLEIMRIAAQQWDAVGFRSPSLLYDLPLLKTLPFAWDSSMPAWDPFQPKRGDCHQFVPFPLNDRCIELPVTVWQDFTLFEELQMQDIAVWREQIDAITEIGGLVNVIVHPDYMIGQARLDLYRALLHHLRATEGLWVAKPAEVATWERSRRAHAGAA